MPMPTPTPAPASGSTPAAAARTALPPLRLDVALVPRASTGRPYADAPRGDTTFIVVDVIRATTSLCVLFERGCREVFVAPNVETARALAPEIDRPRAAEDSPRVLLAGESGGARPDGFDYGNSPAELSCAPVEDRSVLFATTNGTRAIRACAGGRAILAGALRNAQAVAAAALAAFPAGDEGARAPGSPPQTEGDDEQRFDIVIVCAGRDDLPAYDDTLCAGFILRRLMEAAVAQGRTVSLESGAQIALAALIGAEARGGMRAALAQSGAYENIAHLGLSADLEWCAATDVTSVVPHVTGYFPGHDLSLMGVLAEGSGVRTIHVHS